MFCLLLYYQFFTWILPVSATCEFCSCLVFWIKIPWIECLLSSVVHLGSLLLCIHLTVTFIYIFFAFIFLLWYLYTSLYTNFLLLFLFLIQLWHRISPRGSIKYFWFWFLYLCGWQWICFSCSRFQVQIPVMTSYFTFWWGIKVSATRVNVLYNNLSNSQKLSSSMNITITDKRLKKLNLYVCMCKCVCIYVYSILA